MEGRIRARVFRFNPETGGEPRFDTYDVEAPAEVSVLVLLTRIQAELDPTLGFRCYCCGLQLCRSCLMKIDGKKRLACLTVVKPGDEVTIEPPSFPERHVRDLVAAL